MLTKASIRLNIGLVTLRFTVKRHELVPTAEGLHDCLEETHLAFFAVVLEMFGVVFFLVVFQLVAVAC